MEGGWYGDAEFVNVVNIGALGRQLQHCLEYLHNLLLAR
jgi:hypothetical protein